MSPYPERAPVRLGKHSLHYEHPGIAVLVYDGPMSAKEMQALCDVPDVSEHQGRFQLTLCDMTNFGGLDGEARKIGSQRSRPAKIYYTAYIGASFTMRVVVSMWTRATNLLQGPKNAVSFFDDVDAAKAWLIARRQEHLENDAVSSGSTSVPPPR